MTEWFQGPKVKTGQLPTTPDDFEWWLFPRTGVLHLFARVEMAKANAELVYPACQTPFVPFNPHYLMGPLVLNDSLGRIACTECLVEDMQVRWDNCRENRCHKAPEWPSAGVELPPAG